MRCNFQSLASQIIRHNIKHPIHTKTNSKSSGVETVRQEKLSLCVVFLFAGYSCLHPVQVWQLECVKKVWDATSLCLWKMMKSRWSPTAGPWPLSGYCSAIFGYISPSWWGWWGCLSTHSHVRPRRTPIFAACSKQPPCSSGNVKGLMPFADICPHAGKTERMCSQGSTCWSWPSPQWATPSRKGVIWEVDAGDHQAGFFCYFLVPKRARGTLSDFGSQGLKTEVVNPEIQDAKFWRSPGWGRPSMPASGLPPLTWRMPTSRFLSGRASGSSWGLGLRGQVGDQSRCAHSKTGTLVESCPWTQTQINWHREIRAMGEILNHPRVQFHLTSGLPGNTQHRCYCILWCFCLLTPFPLFSNY